MDRPGRKPAGLSGRERIELDSRKKSRRCRMMLSNRFEMPKVREIGRKEARESSWFSILWVGSIVCITAKVSVSKYALSQPQQDVRLLTRRLQDNLILPNSALIVRTKVLIINVEAVTFLSLESAS